MADFLDKTVSSTEPGVSIGRSTFTGNSYGHKTTITEGDLVPVYFSEVLPGDTFSIDTAFLCRMATPIYPVMDNAYMDIFYFFVPNRLVWDHWKEFCGENTTAPWVQSTEYTVPQLKFGYYIESVDINNLTGSKVCTGAVPGSVMNYFGVPCSIWPDTDYPASASGGLTTMAYTEFSVSDLPNRAYRLIWNEFFRSEAVEYPVAVYTDDSDRNYRVAASVSIDYGGRPLKVNRFFDMFSGCLPAPQAGDSVSMGIIDEQFPVVGKNHYWDFYDTSLFGVDDAVYSMHFAGRINDGDAWSHNNFGNTSAMYASTVNAARIDTPFTPGSNTRQITPDNLHALVRDFSIGSINQLRQAFAVQRFYELAARGGSRYREILKSFFSVTSPDARVQIPEYLGGLRQPINMDQVLQTSSTDAVSPQGNTSGYSLTTGVDNSFTKSFVEHGMIIGLACIRVSHTYSQMCMPYWFRKRKFDFYWPQFANLGEQPIFKKYLMPTGLPFIDDSVFGYQEAWVDYRHHPNMLSGSYSPTVYRDLNDATVGAQIYEQQSSIAQAWTYSDFYEMNYDTYRNSVDRISLTPVSLSKEWLFEDSKNVGQTLAVQNEPQFLCDFQFNVTTTRPMPVHSIPGLIDHH